MVARIPVANILSNIPIPDPSILTTEALRREIATLRELLETRLNAGDRAITVFEQTLSRRFVDIDKELSHLRELHGEKFLSIERRFAERDIRQTNMQAASQLAIQTAFANSKESASQQGEGFKDRISALETKIDSNKINQDNVHNDLKERITRLEAKALTVQETRQEGHMTIGSVVGIVSAAVAGVVMLIAVYGLMTHNSPAFNPTVGADTKRVDDLIVQQNEANRILNSRLDALSARLSGSGLLKP